MVGILFPTHGVGVGVGDGVERPFDLVGMSGLENEEALIGDRANDLCPFPDYIGPLLSDSLM